MAQGEENGGGELVQAPVLEQATLFAEAPARRVMPRYTEDQIALALKRSRGTVTGAAVLLGCSHTAIDKRLASNKAEGQRLRDLRESLRIRLVDVAENKIMRAVDSRCWECGGTGKVKVNPRLVGDPTEADCIVCEGTGWHEKKREEIDPTEQRQLALRVLQLFGKKRGWGESAETVKIPREWLSYLEENDLLDEAIGQLLAGVPLSEVYKGTMKSRAPMKIVPAPRRLGDGGAEAGA